MAIFQQDVWDLELIVNNVFLQPISQKRPGMVWYLMYFLARTHRHSVITGCETGDLGCLEITRRNEVAFLTAACFFGNQIMEEVCFGH